MVEPHKDVPEPTSRPKKYKEWQRASQELEEEINPFPGAREYIGTITTSSGINHKVYMPIVFDYADLDMTERTSLYKLGARSIGISYLLFQTWSLPDAQSVMNKLSTAIEILGGK